MEQSTSSNFNRKIQKLILVRHGIALHNVLPLHVQQQQHSSSLSTTTTTTNNRNNSNNNENDVHDDSDILFDPPLTMDGKIQSLMIGETIRTYIHRNHNNNNSNNNTSSMQYMILTSPLTRCLQTTMYAFGIPEVYYPTGNSTTQNKYTTILCHDDLREACGKYHCDRRRTKSQLQQYWENNNNNDIYYTTGIRFHHDMSEDDTLWSNTYRETIYDLQQRIHRFMIWFLSSYNNNNEYQNNDNINDVAIFITHGVWIETMIQMYDPSWSTTYPGKRIYNAEMYYCECVYSIPSASNTTTTTANNNNANASPFNIALQNVQQIYSPKR